MSGPALRAGGPALAGASAGKHRRLRALRDRWDGPARTVLITALLSAALAVTLSRTIFSQLSVNGDEAVYLLQARALEHGHLFPSVTDPAASYTPWLGVIHGSHYVLKYTPVVAAFFALSMLITGGYVAGLAVLAAALVAVTYLLAKELTADRRVAATAAALLAASPVVLVQSALVLPYVLFLVLAELALWALVAGARSRRAGLLALAGFLGGFAFVARTFDALLLLGPPAIWSLWRAGSKRLRLLAGLVGGLVPPAALLLWFDDAATGSPLRLPFSLFQSGDTLGFGVHRVYPGEAGRHFGFAQGWQGLSRHLELLGGGWAFGGVILLALALVPLLRRRASSELLAVLAGGVLLVVGYLFFWGIWNAGIIWGAVRYLGPYYLMPLLISVSILAALGLVDIAAAGMWRGVATVVVAAAVSAVALVPALRSDLALNADNTTLARAVAAQGRSLVYVDTYPDYLGHPTTVISNKYPVGGRTVFALARGGDDFRVLHAFPGRGLYRLRLLGEYDKRPHSFYGAQLERVSLVRGRSITLGFRVNLPARFRTGRLEVIAGGLRHSWTLRPSGNGPFSFVVRPGAIVGRASYGELTASVTTTARRPRVLDHLRIGLSRGRDGGFFALVPAGVVAELGPLSPPPLSVAVG